ncbi:hypothetical protein [Belnapia sp. F-4-1]|uniref:hypothetical protein n=1 Tax=Belnapia sp. F-4-1 TaxID=1545443 RepID=UPI0005BDCE62|nr:hypothetical protein [Belnapia sp. F-4-1]
MLDQPEPNARTRTRAHEAAAMPIPRVVAVRVPAIDRRTPFVEIEVEIGPVAVVVGVAHTRRGWLELRIPQAFAGGPAITVSPAIWGEVEQLALTTATTDPAAKRHLMNHRYQRNARSSTSAPREISL